MKQAHGASGASLQLPCATTSRSNETSVERRIMARSRRPVSSLGLALMHFTRDTSDGETGYLYQRAVITGNHNSAHASSISGMLADLG